MSEKDKPKTSEPRRGNQTVLDRKPETKRPVMYRVILHNDDYTTMDFVVWVLRKVFHKSETSATALMLNIHHKGMGIAGVYTRDIAETKVAQVTHLAQEHGMPLLCTCEPDE